MTEMPNLALGESRVIRARQAPTHSMVAWRRDVPTLAGSDVRVREVCLSDAASLLVTFGTEEVARFISQPPSTHEGFERFIRWTHEQRKAGDYLCFGIVPRGYSTAVGLFQVRRLEPSFATAEWGFAIAAPFWGSGIFVESARLVLDFVFDQIGATRLEARAALSNGRGHGALRKLGAVREGLLRKSFWRNGEHFDQVLWSILPEDRARPAVSSPVTLH